jgi:hypothetical protein
MPDFILQVTEIPESFEAKIFYYKLKEWSFFQPYQAEWPHEFVKKSPKM